MLQVTTGKFYTKPDILEQQEFGVIYSNYSWPIRFDTCVGSIEPVRDLGKIATYVFSYINRIELELSESGKLQKVQLAALDANEIVNEFILLATFSFKALFSTNKSHILENTQGQNENKTKGNPQKIIERYLDSSIFGQDKEIQEFISFVEQVIGLPRAKYNALITFLQVFHNSLQLVTKNFDLVVW